MKRTQQSFEESFTNEVSPANIQRRQKTDTTLLIFDLLSVV